MPATYSREKPSPRYAQLLEQYRAMHVDGEVHAKLPPEQVFGGQSLPRHGQNIKRLIDAYAARTLLDYGSGKGQQYTAYRVDLGVGQTFASIPEYWGVEIRCFDPGYTPFSTLPSGTFDAVISTDVLEHCPEADVPWIVTEMFAYANKFLYANVACYPARKHLANGENAHCTVRPAAWWQTTFAPIAAAFSNIRYYLVLDEPDGQGQLRQTVING